MFWRILEREMHEPDDLYILVGFWPDQAAAQARPNRPDFREDWIMRGVPLTSTRFVDDDEPLAVPIVTVVDTNAYVRRHIERWLDRREAKGDTGQPRTRTQPERNARKMDVDARGVLAAVTLTEGTHDRIQR